MTEGAVMKKEYFDERLLDQPIYPPPEAGRLVGLTTDRVRRWLRGYSYHYRNEVHEQPPVVKRNKEIEGGFASFLDLVDLLVVRQFLSHGHSLQKLRRAFEEARKVLGTDHFARKNLFILGNNIYLEMGERSDDNPILQLLSGGQLAIAEVIKELGTKIDFDRSTQLAKRWYPLGKDGLIVLDPAISFGRPTLIGKAVATSNIFDFFNAERQEVRAVCRWLNLTEKEVMAAVNFEKRMAA